MYTEDAVNSESDAKAELSKVVSSHRRPTSNKGLVFDNRNKDEVRRFLQLLDPDADKFAFTAKADSASAEGARLLDGTLDEHWDELVRLNKAGFGICVVVNETDFKGRKSENIIATRDVWQENDSGAGWNAPLEASVTVRTSPSKAHRHLFVKGLTYQEHAAAMGAMVERYGCDGGAALLTQNLRLPGFYHVKDATKPYLVHIESGDGRRYVRAEIVAAFSEVAAIREREVAQIKQALSFIDPKAGPDYVVAYFREYFVGDREAEGFSLILEWASAPRPTDDDAEEAWTAKLKQQWDDAGRSATRVLTLKELLMFLRDIGFKQAPNISWTEYERDGVPKGKSQANIHAVLNHVGVTVYKDVFARRYYVEGLPGFTELNDAAERELHMLADRLGLASPKDYFKDAILFLAEKNQRHPLREWLDGLTWDKAPRLDGWLASYAGADADSKLVRRFGTLFMIAAVRRARKPGSKFDQMLVLEGPQGVGKSELVRTLAGDDWFEENLQIGADARQVIMQTAGKWIAEIPELKGIRNAEVEAVKQMISRTHDRTDMKFDKWPTDAPRHFVLVGTTNDSEYLRDQTGNRRFWPVKVGTIDLAALADDREQLWAETAFREARGESIVLEESLWSEAAHEQRKREVAEPIVERLEERLWGKDGIVLLNDLWIAAGFPEDRTDLKTQPQRTRIGQAMTKLGWKYRRPRGEKGEKEGQYEKPAPDGRLHQRWRANSSGELKSVSLSICGGTEAKPAPVVSISAGDRKRRTPS